MTNTKTKIKSLVRDLKTNNSVFLNSTLLITNKNIILSDEQKVVENGQKHYKLNSIDSEIPANIYEVGANAYYYMRRLSQDQLVLIINNDNQQNFIKEIFYLSKNIKKQEKSYLLFSVAEDIISMFQNNRVHYKFQFNSRGRLVGFKTKLLSFLINNKDQESVEIDLDKLDENLKSIGVKNSKRNIVREYAQVNSTSKGSKILKSLFSNLLLNYILGLINSKSSLSEQDYENAIDLVCTSSENYDDEGIDTSTAFVNFACAFYSKTCPNSQTSINSNIDSSFYRKILKQLEKSSLERDNEVTDYFYKGNQDIMSYIKNDIFMKYNDSEQNQLWFIYGVDLKEGSTSLNAEDKSLVSTFFEYENSFNVSFTLQEFSERYGIDSNSIVNYFYSRNIDNSYYFINENRLFINGIVWKLYLEDELKHNLKSVKSNMYETESFYSNAMSNVYNATPKDNSVYDRSIVSPVLSDNYHEPNHVNPEKVSYHKEEIVSNGTTKTRKVWVFIVHAVTFLVPNFIISLVFRKKTKDVQMAFREKLTIFSLIVFSWIVILFTNIVLGLILCKNTEKFYKTEELTGLQNYDLGVYMYGDIYNISRFARSQHGKGSNVSPRGVDFSDMEQFGGKDVTFMFPINLSVGCPNLDNIDDKTELKYNNTDNEFNPLYIHSNQNQFKDIEDANWFKSVGSRKLKNMKIGKVVYDKKDLKKQRDDSQQPIAYINNKVYDLSPYFYTKEQPGVTNFGFLPQAVEEVFKDGSFGPDLTKTYKEKLTKLSNIKDVMNCLDSVFYVGDLDPRLEIQCQLTNYLLIAFTGIAIFVTLVKFFAALQLSGKKEPIENSKKFVIFQVPCYTENEESIKRTIDSLSLLDYEDNQKLLFLIADGMVTGSGNEKSTPETILDVLGYNSDIKNDMKYSYKSINEGYNQLNYGKVYSGIYEIEDKKVPFIVVIKVGNEREETKQGNRGKRDSQIILMNFLKNLYYNDPMCPLELEMYNHINNKLGVDPNLYEYILMVDADTMVEPDSLINLVSMMVRDQRIIGLCGETQIYDQNRSVVTMGQVYEYYISHNLAKSFESLFGSVTCLPGCFSMYRIKSPDNTKPLIINKNIVYDYSENKVDTLHKKNLLHLGEDRYLTTLIIKYFPMYKTKFTPYAICKTVVPEKFSILLSQRRRWINSTIHNFFELVLLKDMCGFCLFSMRFIVFLDLIGTLMLPASVIYLVYVIIAAITKIQIISNESIIMMCSIYVIQALVFVIKRKWEHIGWMFIYILGIFFFNFYIPIYSFWNFDDFSWGNTRKTNSTTNGNNNEKVLSRTEEFEENKFDIKKVPLIKVSDYYEIYNNEIISGIETKSMFSNNKTTSYYENNNPIDQQMSHRSMYSKNMNGTNSMYYENNSVIQHNSYHQTNFPTDEEIVQEIKSILFNSNLNQVTKKQIRQILGEVFQTDLGQKKEFINQSIELILKNQL